MEPGLGTRPSPRQRFRATRRALPALMAAAGVLLVAGGACALLGRREPALGGAGRQRIQIEVINRNFSDATLWAISSSGRQRLGIVTGKTNATFTLDWDFSRPLQIEIDLLAGERCVTEPLQADPGDVLELQIDVEFRRSAFCR